MSSKILSVLILQIILFNPVFTGNPKPPKPLPDDEKQDCINSEKPAYFFVVFNAQAVCDGALIRMDWIIMGKYCLMEKLGLERKKSVRTGIRPYQIRRVKFTTICQDCGWGLLITKFKFYNCFNVALIPMPKLKEPLPSRQAQYVYATFETKGDVNSEVCIKRVDITIASKKDNCWKRKSIWRKMDVLCGDKTNFRPSSRSCRSKKNEEEEEPDPSNYDEDPVWPDDRVNNTEFDYDDDDIDHGYSRNSGHSRSHPDYPDIDKDIDNIVYPIYPDTTERQDEDETVTPDIKPTTPPDVHPPKNKYCREICYDNKQTGGFLICEGKVYGFLERDTCDCYKLAFSNLAMSVDKVRMKGKGRGMNATGDEGEMKGESESSDSDSKLSTKFMMVLVVVSFLTQTFSW